MLYILEKTSEYSDSWDYTFLIVAIIAIAIGTVMTIHKRSKYKNIVQNKEELSHDRKILDDPESILKKK